MWTSHSPGISQAPRRSISVAPSAAGALPSVRISAIRPFSINTAAPSTALGWTQSISLAFVRRVRTGCLLAFVVRQRLDRFPAQLFHTRLLVRDGDPLGILQIIQRVEDLISGIASDVGSSRNVDHESCLWRHVSLLCHGHSTLGTNGALAEFAVYQFQVRHCN